MNLLQNLKELINFKGIWPAFMFMGFIFTYSSFFTKSEIELRIGILTLLYSIASWIVNTFAGLGYIREQNNPMPTWAFYTFYCVIILLNIAIGGLYAWFLLQLIN